MIIGNLVVTCKVPNVYELYRGFLGILLMGRTILVLIRWLGWVGMHPLVALFWLLFDGAAFNLVNLSGTSYAGRLLRLLCCGIYIMRRVVSMLVIVMLVTNCTEPRQAMRPLMAVLLMTS